MLMKYLWRKWCAFVDYLDNHFKENTIMYAVFGFAMPLMIAYLTYAMHHQVIASLMAVGVLIGLDFFVDWKVNVDWPADEYKELQRQKAEEARKSLNNGEDEDEEILDRIAA